MSVNLIRSQIRSVLCYKTTNNLITTEFVTVSAAVHIRIKLTAEMTVVFFVLMYCLFFSEVLGENRHLLTAYIIATRLFCRSDV